jgi:hypothetical protein
MRKPWQFAAKTAKQISAAALPKRRMRFEISERKMSTRP